jgi:hypothetical protein
VKSTLRALKGLERNLRRLEEAAEGEMSGKKQLELVLDAIYGDETAAAKLETLRAAGELIPLLANLYDIEKHGLVLRRGMYHLRHSSKGAPVSLVAHHEAATR